MKRKSKMLLAGAVALLGMSYLPQAAATTTTYTTIPTLGNTSLFAKTISFSVGTTSMLMDSGVSSLSAFATTPTGAAFASSGSGLLGMVLQEKVGSSWMTLMTSPASYTKVSTDMLTTGLYDTTYTSSVSLSQALDMGMYRLEVFGLVGSANSFGSFTNTISLAPVPEPEQWAMLLLGLPLIGWAARRKQAGPAAVAA